MSATVAGHPDRLDLAELVARVERSQAETRRFVAEQHELMAERGKLLAKAMTPRVSRLVTPTATMVAALGALTAAAPVLARWFGRGG